MIREKIFRRLPSNIQNTIQKCTNSLTSVTGHELSKSAFDYRKCGQCTGKCRI